MKSQSNRREEERRLCNGPTFSASCSSSFPVMLMDRDLELLLTLLLPIRPAPLSLGDIASSLRKPHLTGETARECLFLR